MLSLGWFATGRGEGSRALLTTVHKSIQRGELPARIHFVFSNREPGEAEGSDQFFRLVHSYGLPLVTYSSRRFRKEKGNLASRREEYDREVAKCLEGYRPDLCVLAGYMLILGRELCQRYTAINLHPALPNGPAGTWQGVIWQLIEAKATETGAMIHLATEEVDRGPTVAYCSFPIRGELYDKLWQEVEGRSVGELQGSYGEELPLFQLIRQEGRKREVPLLLSTLKALAKGEVRIEKRQVTDAAGRALPPQRFNSQVEAMLSS